jgi:UDP-glucose 4-epimerase
VRVVITGATGNVGTSVLAALSGDDRVNSILGLARRVPAIDYPKVEWQGADVTEADLTAPFRGADVVIHLAWLIQPSRDEALTERVNVGGSERVLRAAAEAGVPKLVYASSIGAYSPGPKHDRVDESHPTDGIETSFYSRHKAAVERLCDRIEQDHPELALVRLRPALIFKRDAASEIRRLFAGPLLPRALVRRRLIPLVPGIPELRFQAVHSLDVGEAYRLAALEPVSGAFNLAAEPVLDSERLAELLHAAPLRIPPALLRRATDWSWRLRLQPTPPGWLDMALNVPLLDTTRAREELGWRPRYSSEHALLELLEGIRDGDGLPTPPLEPFAGGPLRVREFLTGVGARP